MAAKRFDPLKIRGLQRVAVAGSFQPNGTSAPTNVKGKGFTVARTNVGHYTITFEDSYSDFVNALASVRRVKATPTKAQVGVFDASAKTLDIYTYSFAPVAGAGSAPLNLVSGRILGVSPTFNFQNSANQGGILSSDSNGAQIATLDSLDTKLRFPISSTARVLFSTCLPQGAGITGIGLQISARQLNNTAPGATENAALSCFYGFDNTIQGSVPSPTLSVDNYATYNLVLSQQPVRPGAQASLVLSPLNNTGNVIEVNSAMFTFSSSPGAIVPSDISADANASVNFMAMFRNTGVNF